MVVVVPSELVGSEVSDYDTLISTATGILGRAPIVGAMTLATMDINRRLRVREMLVEQTGTNALPEDMLQPETVEVNGDTYSPVSTARQLRNYTFAVLNGQITTKPEANEDIFLRYYARQDVLTEGDASALLTAYPEIFLYGLLWHHSRLVRDEAGAAAWGPAFTDAIDDANQADVNSRMSSLAMTPVPQVVV